MVPGDLLSFAACVDMDSVPVTCMGTHPCEPHPPRLTQLTVPMLPQGPIARDRLHPSAMPLITLPAPEQEHV